MNAEVIQKMDELEKKLSEVEENTSIFSLFFGLDEFFEKSKPDIITIVKSIAQESRMPNSDKKDIIQRTSKLSEISSTYWFLCRLEKIMEEVSPYLD